MTKEQEKKILNIDNKLDMTSNDETTISLLYQKADLLEEIIQQLQEENKQKDSLYEHTINELRRVDSELAEKEKIIENAINEVENLRQYFSEDLQVEFITILEILKNKKVIDW